MRKKTIIILSGLLTFISLIAIVMSYYGYIRYFQIKRQKPTLYIEQYKNLPLATEEKTIISFCADLDKLEKIKPFISSILDQTVRVNRILFPCPEGTELPKYLKDTVNLCPIGVNYGLGKEFVPILLKEKNESTNIIVLDTNVIYGKGYIESLVAEAEKYPRSIITDQNNYGILIKPKFYDSNILEKNMSVLDKKWFLQNGPAEGIKVITCDENHRY